MAFPQSFPQSDAKRANTAKAVRGFYSALTNDPEDDDAECTDWSDRFDAAQEAVRIATCLSHFDLIEKLRVFELSFFEDGGDYTDGRELAWLGTLKADVAKLANQRNLSERSDEEDAPPRLLAHPDIVAKLKRHWETLDIIITMATDPRMEIGPAAIASGLGQLMGQMKETVEGVDEITPLSTLAS